MQPLTDAQRAVLTAPTVEVGFGADLVDDAGRPVEDLSDDVVAFTVERSSHATIHGSCQLTLLRDLAWGVDRVRPWVSVSRNRLALVDQTVIDRPAKTVSQISDDVADWAAGTGSSVDGSSGALRLAQATFGLPAGMVAHLDPGTLGLADGATVTSAPAVGGSTAWTVQGTGPIYRAAGVNGRPYLEHSSTGTGLRWAGNLSAGNSTVFVVARMRGGARQRILSGISNNWLLGWWQGQEDVHYAMGWVDQQGQSATTDLIAYSARRTSGLNSFRRWGTLLAENSNGTAGPNGLTTNGHNGTSEFSDSDVYEVIAYNRALTDTEVQQVFDYFASRYLNATSYATSGTWTSPPLDLSTLQAVSSSLVDWQASIPAATTLTVETSTDGGITWQAAVDGGPITGATPDGTAQARLTLTSDGTATPEVSSLRLSASQSEQSHTETVTRVEQETARFEMGVFIPTTPDIQAGDTPRGREVSGVDLLWLLDREVGDTYVVAAGTSCLDAIRTVLTDAGVGATTLLLQGDRQSTTLTAPAVWLLTDQPSTWLRVVNDLLAQIGYRGLWVDEQGRYRSEPYQPPDQRGVEWTFDTTDPDTNIIEAERSLSADVWGQVNWWRFVRSGSATEPVEGNGIYTVDRIGTDLPRRRTVFVDAADQAALVAEGNRIVAEDTANVRLVSLACGPLPFGHQDLVRLRDPELALDARCLVRRWSLSSDGSASVELEVL